MIPKEASLNSWRANHSEANPLFTTIVTRLRASGCVFAEEEARLLLSAAQTPDDLNDMVERRAEGMPLEHVIGWAEFCGLRIADRGGAWRLRASLSN